ncbi:glutathione S-transferase theta-2 isoform X1 [Lampris incognitus]|uniref:glutathione S-transferase theta-2 isoform X1 n=1 Tax=Lampris incognitus TaxID=2546036 RepID=UPI0024B564ED|nr:glutathione S-transferase theta-2 isoform X1 [Lampris incognitus]
MTGRKAVEVYLDLLSQPCRAVHILLNYNRVPHSVRTVALRRGENKTPEFTKLNLMQKVPVMVDNGFVLTESDAILKYLVSRYDIPQHWYPRQLERRARVDEYTAWHHTHTRPHAAKVFILEVLLPRMMGSPPDPVKLSRALAELGETLDRLESMFLKRQPFLCGDDITLADLLAICELMQLGATEMFWRTDHSCSNGAAASNRLWGSPSIRPMPSSTHYVIATRPSCESAFIQPIKAGLRCDVMEGGAGVWTGRHQSPSGLTCLHQIWSEPAGLSE